jgi:hypothetical protein
MKCFPLKFKDESSFDEINELFEGCEQIRLGQYWMDEVQVDYLPAAVRVGFSPESLFVFAELNDRDIYNPVNQDHLPAYLSGDVFEMFFRPLQQEAYSEFHVTPDNFKFQLKIPSQKAFFEKKSTSIPEDWLVQDRTFFSETFRDRDQQSWSVFARVPMDMVQEQGEVSPGDEWLFSFSRYDYTRGADKPVLSSSSKHQQARFHLQQDWGRLKFYE